MAYNIINALVNTCRQTLLILRQHLLHLDLRADGSNLPSEKVDFKFHRLGIGSQELSAAIYQVRWLLLGSRIINHYNLCWARVHLLSPGRANLLSSAVGGVVVPG